MAVHGSGCTEDVYGLGPVGALGDAKTAPWICPIETYQKSQRSQASAAGVFAEVSINSSPSFSQLRDMDIAKFMTTLAARQTKGKIIAIGHSAISTKCSESN